MEVTVRHIIHPLTTKGARIRIIVAMAVDVMSQRRILEGNGGSLALHQLQNVGQEITQSLGDAGILLGDTAVLIHTPGKGTA